MKKQILIIPALLAAVALLWSSAACAEEKVDLRKGASAEGTVYIENIVGSITVQGWDKKEIYVTGSLGDDVEELKFETGKRKSFIEVKYPLRARNLNKGAKLHIMVPKKSRVEVESASAGITATGLQGVVKMESVSGSVEFRGRCKVLECESVSGSVRVAGSASTMELSTISGSVKAKGQEAEMEAETVSGSINLNYERLLDLSAESVSGSIKVKGDLDDRGSFSCETVSGSITFTVPGDVNAEFEVTTFNGSIDNEFGQRARRTSRYAPGKELEFQNGDGEADVQLNSFSGSVRVRKE